MYMVCTGHNKEVMRPQHEHDGKSGDEARGTGQQTAQNAVSPVRTWRSL